MADLRQQLVTFLREEIEGPIQPDEELRTAPNLLYSAGILFPRQQSVLEDEETTMMPSPKENIDELQNREAPATEIEEDTTVMASSYFPGAMGITVAVESATASICVDIDGAQYFEEKRQDPKTERFFRVWRRQPLNVPPVNISLGADDETRTITHDVLDGLALHVVARAKSNDTRLITVALHTTKTATRSHPSAEECFFQMGFKVCAVDGMLCPVESQARNMRDDEEASLALLYRQRLAFATGHGCAAGWETVEDGSRAQQVWTETIPDLRIPPILPRQSFGLAHNMQFLSGDGVSNPAVALPDALKHTVDAYAQWIEERHRESQTLQGRLQQRAIAHIELCETALARMRQGLNLLASNGQVLKAFMLANKAILQQQYHVKRERRQVDDAWQALPTHYQSTDGSGDTGIRGYWRSFQIMFLLMNLEAALEPDEHRETFRDEVDLIWFPTGGGKTEAYLGLAAYMIFMKRLSDPTHRGCHVLMRYTLRLLTAQQFQRACGMICACEIIRQNNPDELGDTSITIGLWVGNSLTPNRRKTAIQNLRKWKQRSSDEENTFQVLTCPWCGTAMDNPARPGYQVNSWPETVHFICPESRCHFSSKARKLPIIVIDEDLYHTPATMIIGTVDKFAMLTWRGDASRLLGQGDGLSPPGLIIQDELHLISGPLGTMVGLYESMIEYICRFNGGRPKIVASTATIRRAQEQCRALYNRSAQLFPPSGLDASDNFFATEETGDRAQAGREYIGVMCTAAPSPITALVRSASSLLQGIRSIELPEGVEESARDPWWTLVMYFNALRELGRAATLVDGDIPEYLNTLRRRRNIPSSENRYTGQPVELTSRRTGQEIKEVLERLAIKWSPDAPSQAYNTLLATNMIAVGVDVDRLGLMMVVGQPKTTSEYIQASSRVGRSSDAPGLVVTLYNPGKPRDRSHYEHFWEYHQSFYRHVEPTSVTPFSPPAIERAARALVVIAARHIARINAPTQLNRNDPRFVEALQFLVERAHAIDPDHADYFSNHIEFILRDWLVDKQPPDEWGGFGDPPDERPLMYPAGSPPRPEWAEQAWPTPTSMRSVDASCIGHVTQVYPTSTEGQNS